MNEELMEVARKIVAEVAQRDYPDDIPVVEVSAVLAMDWEQDPPLKTGTVRLSLMDVEQIHLSDVGGREEWARRIAEQLASA